MLCPVCGKKMTTNRICTCGYDPTRDYERRPTLSALRPKDWLQAPAARSGSLLADAETQLTTLLDALHRLEKAGLSPENRATLGSRLREALLLVQPDAFSAASQAKTPALSPVASAPVPQAAVVYPLFAATYSKILIVSAAGTVLEINSIRNAWGGFSSYPTPIEGSLKGISQLIGWNGCFLALKDGVVSRYKLAGRKLQSVSDSTKLSGVAALAVGANHMAALRENGTVTCFFSEEVNSPAMMLWRTSSGIAKALETDSWTEIRQIAAGQQFTLGLRQDGSILYAGSNFTYKRQVETWRNIVQICACKDSIFALSKSGHIHILAPISTGLTADSVKGWTNIVSLAASSDHLVGLKKDGTAIACGSNTFHKCGVKNWGRLDRVLVLGDTTIGIQDSGMVLLTGESGCFSKRFFA